MHQSAQSWCRGSCASELIGLITLQRPGVIIGACGGFLKRRYMRFPSTVSNQTPIATEAMIPILPDRYSELPDTKMQWIRIMLSTRWPCVMSFFHEKPELKLWLRVRDCTPCTAHTLSIPPPPCLRRSQRAQALSSWRTGIRGGGTSWRWCSLHTALSHPAQALQIRL